MASWQTPLCPFTIDFEPGKLEEIRVAVVDAFYAVPRGGVEIGGLLYGKRSGSTLEIVDFRKIETEYLTGPSFDLSANDRAGLRKLLAETKFKDPSIQPVGWFHSHTRSGIHLSPKDLELYREFFPDPWQVALVLRPEKLGSVQGGYFFRGPDGEVQADASALEFPLLPYAGEKREAEAVEEIVPEPVAPPPAPAPEPLLFQAIGTSAKTSWKKKALLIAVALAAACLVYWFAMR